MHKIFRIFFIIFLFAVYEYTAFAAEHSLIVGTSADYPPFTFVEQGHVTGFDVELINAVASSLDRKIQLKAMPFDELIPALQGEKIDMAVSAMTATPNRIKIVDFSMKYYLPSFSIVYLKANPIKTKEQFNNKTIAVIQNSSMEEFLKEYAKHVSELKIVPMKQTEQLFSTLESGMVDCILIETAQARIFCAKKPILDYIDTQSSYDGLNYAIAFPKGSKLRYQVDDILLQLKVTGEFDNLKNRWLALSTGDEPT